MDDKGNLYWEEAGKLFNAYQKTEVEVRPKSLVPLSEAEYKQVRGMNRAERRAWFRKNKKKQPQPKEGDEKE